MGTRSFLCTRAAGIAAAAGVAQGTFCRHSGSREALAGILTARGDLTIQQMILR